MAEIYRKDFCNTADALNVANYVLSKYEGKEYHVIYPGHICEQKSIETLLKEAAR